MKTPPEILEKFENAAQGLDYGTITLSLIVKQGKRRYLINREESFIPTDLPLFCFDQLGKFRLVSFTTFELI